MLIINRKHGYLSQRKYIQGTGFVDSLSSTLRGVGSYISQNRDLLAKPLLGAVGDLAALGVTEGGKSIISHLINKKRKNNVDQIDSKLPPKSVEILKSLMASNSDSNIPLNYTQTPVTNIIGSGIKRF